MGRGWVLAAAASCAAAVWDVPIGGDGPPPPPPPPPGYKQYPGQQQQQQGEYPPPQWPQSPQWGPPQQQAPYYGGGQPQQQQQQQQYSGLSAANDTWADTGRNTPPQQQEQPRMDYYEWQRQQQEAEEAAREEAKKQEAIRWMAARFPGVETGVREKFLKARKFQAQEASEMLEASLRWRRAYGCPVDPVPIAHQLALGTVFLAGRDYDGHPILYHIGGGLPGSATNAQVSLAARAAVFWMEKATKMSPDGKVTVVVVRDAAFAQPGHRPAQRGLGSLRYPRHLGKILEANFPESLAKAVVYPGDGWFAAIWRVASRFVDVETRAKINLVANKRDLLKFVPHDQLLAFLGGANPFRFDVNAVIPNYPGTRFLPPVPGQAPHQPGPPGQGPGAAPPGFGPETARGRPGAGPPPPGAGPPGFSGQARPQYGPSQRQGGNLHPPQSPPAWTNKNVPRPPPNQPPGGWGQPPRPSDDDQHQQRRPPDFPPYPPPYAFQQYPPPPPPPPRS